jgi:hypothetical protein
MKYVLVRAHRAGRAYGQPFKPGDILELPKNIADSQKELAQPAFVQLTDAEVRALEEDEAKAETGSETAKDKKKSGGKGK